MAEDSFFQFKSFRIYQQNDKVFNVNTDGILLLAWLPLLDHKNVLEIGCGTGVIAIGLENINPKTNHFTAIDISENAYHLTKKNSAFNQSSIEIFHCSLNEFCETTQQKYAVIVSNPPFFLPHFPSQKAQNIQAKYTDSLPFESLIASSSRLLTDEGSCYLVLPYLSLDAIQAICQLHHLHIVRQLIIYPKVGKNPHRILLEIKKQKAVCEINSLAILDANGSYTVDYIALTKRFYTIF